MTPDQRRQLLHLAPGPGCTWSARRFCIEQRQRSNRVPELFELVRHLQHHDASEAEARQPVRSTGLHADDVIDVAPRQVFDAQSLPSVDELRGRLQPVDGLLRIEVADEVHVSEQQATDTVGQEERCLRSSGAKRYYG